MINQKKMNEDDDEAVCISPRHRSHTNKTKREKRQSTPHKMERMELTLTQIANSMEKRGPCT